jgi:ATP-binding cassette subfamily F protein 3
MAQSMERRLSKVERLELPPDNRVMAFPLPPITKSGKVALIVKNLSYTFGDRTIFKNVSFELERGTKAAIIAPNGVGKTTLLNLISGRLPLQTGSVELGYQVNVALFDQDQTRALDLKKSLFDNVAIAASHASEQTIRGMLGAFLFSGDTIHKPAGVLSGGERNRLGMVKTLLQNANLLLLDEPTNHLDIPSKDVLLDALQRYTGTMLFVSHDHDFVNNLATHIIVLTADGATLYHGTYDEYLYQKMTSAARSAESTSFEAKTTEKQKKDAPAKSTLHSHELQKKIASTERTISKLELEINKIQESFADLEYGTPPFDTAMKQLHTLKDQLAAQLAAWEKLHE